MSLLVVAHSHSLLNSPPTRLWDYCSDWGTEAGKKVLIVQM